MQAGRYHAIVWGHRPGIALRPTSWMLMRAWSGLCLQSWCLQVRMWVSMPWFQGRACTAWGGMTFSGVAGLA